MEAVNIVKYTDYVPYVRDLVEEKRREGDFSFRTFCKKSGFKSPTYLKWVLDEVRPISTKSVNRFAVGLDLGKRETRYLQLLVNYKETEDIEQKKFFFEEILDRQAKREENAFVRERYEYLSHWYYVSVRELVAHPDFRDDPQWIQDKLCGTVSVWDIKHAMTTLERLQLIVRDDRGKFYQNEAELHTGQEVESMAAYNYHSEILKLSQEILRNTSHEVREFSSLVSLMDQQTFAEIKTKMQAFQQEIVQLIQKKSQGDPSASQATPKTKTQEMYMLNMQLVPCTQFDEKEFLGEPHEKK